MCHRSDEVELATQCSSTQTWHGDHFVVVGKTLGKMKYLKLDPPSFLPVLQMKPGSSDIKFTGAHPNEEHAMKEM